MWFEWLHHAITSSGAVDAYRPVVLDATGKLDKTFLPTSVDITTFTANISAPGVTATGASSPSVIVTDTTTPVSGRIQATDSVMYVGTTTAHSVEVIAGNAAYLQCTSAGALTLTNGATLHGLEFDGTGDGLSIYESKILRTKSNGFSLVQDATYAMTDKLFGILVVLNGTSGYVWVGLLRGGGNAVVEWWNTGSTVFNTTKDTADRINIYYDAGTSKYTIQNKKAATQSLFATLIGA